MDKIVLGPLLIPLQWLFFFIAGIITYFIVKIILKEQRAFFKQFTEETVNGLITWFLVYKFSVILFRPHILLHNPIEILYFTGGTKGSVLGAIIAVVMLVYKVYKNKWDIPLTVQMAVYIAITFIISYWVIHTVYALT